MLSPVDVRNLALQRTSTLIHIPLIKKISPSYLLWSKFQSNSLIDLEVSLRREAIIRDSFDEISREFEEIVDTISLPDPLQVMDIGCGLGLINVLFTREREVSRIILVDIEESEHKHHGFQQDGAGYNSLAKSAEFLRQNVSGNPHIETINPRNVKPEDVVEGQVNVIISLISCGFHYPASTYLGLFDKALSPDGTIVLDLRAGVDHAPLFEHYVVSKQIAKRPTYDRVALVRR